MAGQGELEKYFDDCALISITFVNLNYYGAGKYTKLARTSFRFTNILLQTPKIPTFIQFSAAKICLSMHYVFPLYVAGSGCFLPLPRGLPYLPHDLDLPLLVQELRRKIK